MFREKTVRHAATLSPQTTGLESSRWLKLKWGEKEHLKMKHTFMHRQQVESFILNGNKIDLNIPKLLQYYYSVTVSLLHCMAFSQFWWDSFVVFSIFSVPYWRWCAFVGFFYLKPNQPVISSELCRKIRITRSYLTLPQN